MNSRNNMNNSNVNNYNFDNEYNNKLREDLNNYKRENQLLKDKINKLTNDNNKLNNELIKANKIISNYYISNNKSKDNNSYDYLLEMMKVKDKEINDLKQQLQNISNNKKSVNYDDIIFIHFISLDQKINCPIKCLKTDIFAEVEEQLYQQYESYRETNNNFITKGNIVLRSKKICENNIQNGDKVQLVKI